MNVEITEKLGPAFAQLAANLEGAGRVRVSTAMGSEVRSLIVRHLTKLGESRHSTADRLGAAHTGYIASLAENFDQSSTVSVDEDGVSIAMRHPVIARALRDITITAKKQFLTIPLNAMAYGRRAGEFGKGEVQFIRKGEGGGSGEKKEHQPLDPSRPAYLLVRSVTQRRDPSLLSSFHEITTAAALGAKREIKTILTEAGRLS